MKSKVKDKRLEIVREIIVRRIDPECIYLFGSRAIENARRTSDYDIAFSGSEVSFRDFRQMKDEIDREIGIYSCDLIDLAKSNDNFREYIINEGKLIYERN